MKKRYTDEQIIGFLKQAAAGTPVKELCRKHGLNRPGFHRQMRNQPGLMTSAKRAPAQTRKNPPTSVSPR